MDTIKNKKRKEDSSAVKLDMHKANDRVGWIFSGKDANSARILDRVN